MKVFNPFGPVLAKVKIPKKIINKINIEVDKIILNKKLSKKNDYSKKVVGQVYQEIRIDDDQDAVWLTVDIGNGSSCHVGYRSCFYRSIPLGKIENAREIEMKFEEKEKKFDPEKVYKDQPNPTKI